MTEALNIKETNSKCDFHLSDLIGLQWSFYFLSAFLFFSCQSLAQQYLISKSTPGITIESLMIVDGKVVVGSGDQSFHFNGEIAPYRETPELVEPPSFYFGEGKIDSYAPYNEGFLVSINDSLKYFDGSELRIFEAPTEHVNFKAPLLSGCSDEFAIVSNGRLWIWNPVEYILREISLASRINVISDECDAWGAYWVSDGKVLYSVISSTSSRLPEMIIEEYHIDDGMVSFAVKAYHPHIENLNIEYSWNEKDEKWQRISNNQLYELPIPTTDVKSIQFRASVDDEYYTYSEKYDVNVTGKEEANWFWYFLFIPLLIISVSLYLLSRDKKVKSELALLKEQHRLKEEAQEMTFKTQRLKMNPHFLFNAITAIQGLIAAGRNDEARKFLGQYAYLSRHLMKQSELKLVPLEDEIKFIEDYIQLEQLTFNGTFSYEIVNDAEDDIEIAPMLIQPLVENAIRHGLKIKRDGHIKIYLKNDSKDLHIELTDNGIGRKAAKNQSSSSDHTGIAIESIKERLRNYDKFRKGALNIQDLYDHEGTGIGTQCILRIPI